MSVIEGVHRINFSLIVQSTWQHEINLKGVVLLGRSNRTGDLNPEFARR